MKTISNQRYIGAVDEVSAQYDKSLERLGLENKIAEFVLTENEIEELLQMSAEDLRVCLEN